MQEIQLPGNIRELPDQVLAEICDELLALVARLHVEQLRRRAVSRLTADIARKQ